MNINREWLKRMAAAEDAAGSVSVGGMFHATEEHCGGCGAKLAKENAWMVDGCPCNSSAGCNRGNSLVSEWRAELLDQAKHALTATRQRLAEVEDFDNRLKAARDG